ncbi:MAG: hypothetical protein IKM74_02605 [Bacteroidales bacterium]|nr:hypothetical protein [Bacteroidales bacterium]
MSIIEYLLNNQDSSIDIIKHLVSSLSNDQLVELRDRTTNDDLWFYADKYINPKPTEDKVKMANPPLQQLLDTFANSRGEQLKHARRELQKRFDGQSFPDQESIIEAFMKKGTKTDVVWCSKHLVENYAETVVYQDQTFNVYGTLFWKDEFLDVVKYHWERDMENYKLLKVITQFDSPEYLKAKIRSMENDCEGVIDGVAYPDLLLKVCENSDYPLPKDRLTPFQYAYISAKTNRQISEAEATAAIAWAAEHETFWHSHFVRSNNGRIVFHDYKFSIIGLALWSLSKLGHTSTIIRFNEWILSVIKTLEASEYLDFATIDNTIQENLNELKVF